MRPLIKFTCPHCKQRMWTEAHTSGTALDCPTCGKSLTVPRTKTRLWLEIVGGIMLFLFGLAAGTAPSAKQQSREYSSMPTFKGDKTGQPTQEDYEKAAKWLLDRDKEP